MDVEWKWMQKHASNIYRKNFHLPFNVFINVQIGFLCKTTHQSHLSNPVQDILQEALNSRFIKTHEWPQWSPDCNPLDYYFWNKVNEKVYENRLNKPFENDKELKKRILSVWKDIAFSLPEI